jgi:hypothetical protein
MNLKIFFFFYFLAFIWLYSQDPTSSQLWFSLLVAIPLSPIFAMASFAIYGVVTKIFEWLGKSKPKDGWWKDTGGY